jgi:hypothetical protein
LLLFCWFIFLAHLVHFLRGKNYSGSFLCMANPKTILFYEESWLYVFSSLFLPLLVIIKW